MNHFDEEISIIPIINEVEDYPDYIPTSKLDINTQPSTSLLESSLIKPTELKLEEAPIFTLDKVQYQFPGEIGALQVSNNILAVVINKNRILRIDLGEIYQVEDIEIIQKKTGDAIKKIFLDPTGKHLIIVTESEDTYYLYEKWKKPKLMSKFRGINIQSIAWRGKPSLNDNSTGLILIGTNNGKIFEAEIQPTDEFFKREERYFKQVYSFNDEMLSITGLRFEAFPTDPRKYVVIVATPIKLYQFIGDISSDVDNNEGGMFSELFQNNTPNEKEIISFHKNSECHFRSQFHENGWPSIPKQFVWTTGKGMYTGELIFGSQKSGGSVINNSRLVSYPEEYVKAENKVTKPVESIPLSVAITQFHTLLLYKKKIKAMCNLDDSIIYEEDIPLEQDEKILGLKMDFIKDSYWLFTTHSLYEILITDEDRNVWQIYLKQKMFDAALSFTKNESQKDKVLTSQADYYYSQQRYNLSAEYYAQIHSISFEEIVLRFINKNENDALRIFLIRKLEKLKNQDGIQKTLICTWLVEIFINKINQISNKIEDENLAYETLKKLSDSSEEKLANAKNQIERMEEDKKMIQDEFKSFMHANKNYLDKKAIYQIISSHGRMEELLMFAELVKDYERMLVYYLQEKNYEKVISILNKQSNLDLYYKFSPVLMECMPYETVNMWIHEPKLNPRHLIPSLLKYDPKKSFGKEGIEGKNQAIRYLNYVIQNLHNTDMTIHNYLLFLYAKQATNEDCAELLEFLMHENRPAYYDLQYALRICTQNRIIHACVYLYSEMRLYEQAVNLALKHNDIDLAKYNADKVEDNDILRKKLWINIVKYVIEENKDIKMALQLLKSCELLKISDILPYFPDFVLIEDFKDEICETLEEYNVHIDELKKEMDEATKSAEDIRFDIRELKNKHTIIPVNELCRICNKTLLTRQFYIFPCQHLFHADCLLNSLLKSSPIRRNKRIKMLYEQINEISKKLNSNGMDFLMNDNSDDDDDNANNSSGLGVFNLIKSGGRSDEEKESAYNAKKLDKLKDELQELVTSECPLCGDTMISSIDIPFLDNVKESELIASWEI
ncbi:hypothetical protein BCR36DRAFT_314682 [Piromyces finnis]|uniref:RING-type domain-containing protein n=1 Tax=Piromyces finnis TaxID=1754191 RepID=A0A1Y1VNH3_9FUNG|nr:hypothetical protein BCR36DRAFT_314682 [Piromyces finnis]|eukprot:ORX60830.1 hypothetical protein BCR36DRAFT_314682 [Piromyces finnis]